MMPSLEGLLNILGIAAMSTIIALSVTLAIKMRLLKSMQTEVDKLKKSLDEMDEQAKLIVRTDIELNKTQEELDKKMTGLYALQKISRSFSTTLEENQIFKSIDAEYMGDLGFEKSLVFLWQGAEKKFQPKLVIGYEDTEVEEIKLFLENRKDLFLNAIKHEKTLSSLSFANDNPADREMLQRTFFIHSFVVSPILPKEGNKGFLFVGTVNADTIITDGDEELINILGTQLGQALENARLFEKTWKAQQDLENKVEERTRELTLALEEVKNISKRKTDFVSSVSHELRTPLTSIKGYAAILLTGKLGELPKDIHERLDKINRHSDELVHMVNDLLDISRIESGRVAMRQEQFDLPVVATKVKDLLGVQLKAKQIDLEVDIAADAKTVFADRSQIERVFINLIGNAIKFTPEKGRITICSRGVDGGAVQIDVRDTGCGMPPDAQEKIFEEFYRVENAINEQVKGTGLGLALVKHIIEAHKGKIWVKSKEGAGSTFSFTLPKPT